jgi:hypothetical protein
VILITEPSSFSSSEKWPLFLVCWLNLPFQYASLQAIATYATITNGL